VNIIGLRSWAAAVVVLVLALAGAGWVRGQTATAGNEVWLLPIDTEITAATTTFVRTRIERANREQPLAVVLYLDTPGGAVNAMQDIVGVILHEARVPTIAVVQNAFSAGALIAMSAERLAMLPGSSIGAALPIQVTPTGISAVDEKFSSALRGEFRAVAEARGRNAQVAEGMVDERIEIPGLSTSTELVTLTSRQAVEHGIADIEAATLQEALTSFGYGGADIQRLEPGLTERLGGFLAQPWIAAALLVLGIGGLLIEIFTPGFGVPGAIGVVALGIFAAAAYIASPAGIFDIALLVIGVILLAAEVLIIPGFGVAGVLGIAALLVAVVRIFQESSLPVLGYSALFGGVLLGVLLWILPNSRLASVFRLSTRLTTPPAQSATALVGERSDLAAAVGVALSDLRPAGVARFGSERVDVVSEGDFVPAGSVLRVLRVEGNRITVRAAEDVRWAENDPRVAGTGTAGTENDPGATLRTDTTSPTTTPPTTTPPREPRSDTSTDTPSDAAVDGREEV